LTKGYDQIHSLPVVEIDEHGIYGNGKEQHDGISRVFCGVWMARLDPYIGPRSCMLIQEPKLGYSDIVRETLAIHKRITLPGFVSDGNIRQLPAPKLPSRGNINP